MIKTDTAPARPCWNQFSHAGFCALLLCWTLAGCASSKHETPASPANDKPRAAADKQVTEDIMEAVFRHMAQPGPDTNDLSRPINRDHKVYFLSISQWYDPSPAFLRRMNDMGVPVKSISAGEWRGQFIHDRATGDRGAAFYIGRITMVGNEADVEAVIQPGGKGRSCGWFYRLNRQDNKWVVVRETWKWMS